MSGSYGKGIEFEKFVVELFRKAGFIVQHNVVLQGKSGAKHQIDVLAMYRTPVTEFKVLVECKNWDKPINKDVVMKVYNEVQDLGFDKGIIITQSYPTVDALRSASATNVEIIDRYKLASIIEELGVKELKELMKSEEKYSPHAKFISMPEKVREEVAKYPSYKVLYLPLYILNYVTKSVKREGILRRKKVVTETRYVVIVDGIFGQYGAITNKGLDFMRSALVPLTSEEVATYKILTSLKQAYAEHIASYMGISVAKARKILEGLVAKQLAERYRGKRRYTYYYKPFILAYREHKINFQEHDNPEPNAIIIKPIVDVGALLTILKEVADIEIEKYRIVYYPIVIAKEDETKEIIIDGVTGNLFKRPEIIVKLESVISTE